jgi:hypothetical protein
MDAKYYLLISQDTDQFEAPALALYEFDQYSDLWHFLEDLLWMEDIRWYQIFWGDTLMMQKMVR